jgi:hypothetical protein
MGLYGNIRKVFNKAGNAGAKLFQKGEVGGVRLFGKGSEGSKALGGLARGFSNASGVAGSIGNTITNIANNPAVMGVAGSFGAGGLGLLGGAQALGRGLSALGSSAHQISDMSRQKNYRGDAGQVVGSALERAKQVHDTGPVFY